jgi:hypothetical protein
LKYHLSQGDGKTYGPYSVQELEGFSREGRINSTSMLCREGDSNWIPASNVITGVTVQVAPSALTGVPWIPVSLTGPVLTTLCCCLPGGIVSIVYASKANTFGAAGMVAEANQAKSTSNTWLIVSVILGFLVNGFWFLGTVAQ